MVNACGKVPALALLGVTLALAGCGPGSRSEGGEEPGLVGEARAQPSTLPAHGATAPVEEGVSAAADGPLGASSGVDTEESSRGTEARPPTSRPKPRVERRTFLPPVAASEPPEGGSSPEADVVPTPESEDGSPLDSLSREAPESGVVIPAGSRMVLELQTRLSSQKAWPGDRFRARVTEDLLDDDGMVLVPRGAVVEGVVSRAVRGDADREPGIELEPRALLVAGRVYELHAEVAEADFRSEGLRNGRDMAGKAAAGAAAGAVLGRILGKDAKSTIAGAVAGAAAGAAVAAATGDDQVVLDKGALLEIVLQRELRLEEGRRPR